MAPLSAAEINRSAAAASTEAERRLRRVRSRVRADKRRQFAIRRVRKAAERARRRANFKLVCYNFASNGFASAAQPAALYGVAMNKFRRSIYISSRSAECDNCATT